MTTEAQWAYEWWRGRYPSPDMANADDLRRAYVAGWMDRHERRSGISADQEPTDDFGDAAIERRRRELEDQGVDLSTIPNESRLKHDTRDAGTCQCGEPVEQVQGMDRVWRWAHERRGIVRDHVATPIG